MKKTKRNMENWIENIFIPQLGPHYGITGGHVFATPTIPGDYWMDYDAENSWSLNLWLTVRIENYDQIENELNNDYDAFCAPFANLAQQYGLNAEVLCDEYHQTITFQIS